MSAAKWHAMKAEQATANVAASEAFNPREAHRYVEAAAHHATAADALEALAVVAPLLALCACADMVAAWDANGDDIEMRLNDQHRAALATLAKIASEGK